MRSITIKMEYQSSDDKTGDIEDMVLELRVRNLIFTCVALLLRDGMSQPWFWRIQIPGNSESA